MSRRQVALVNAKDLDPNCVIEVNSNHEGGLKSKAIALYHIVFEDEDFDTAAHHIFELVKNAQTQCPGENRILS